MANTDKRAKFDALLKALKVPSLDLKVGIFSDAGASPSGLTVAEVATYHEFGYGVPERSFLRAYLEQNQEKVLDTLIQQLQSVLDGKRPLKTALDRVGLLMVGEIKERISDGIAPPLEEATIAKKTRAGNRGDVPLINYGQLRNSIVHKVEGS